LQLLFASYPREGEKQAELIAFGSKRLYDSNCSIKGVGAGDEATLIENFGKVVKVFKSLPEYSQKVIKDITDKMGAGMAEYVAADLGQGTVDQAAYDRYCHMVAGLVGEGLSRLFVARGLEADSVCGQGERVWPFCEDAKTQPANLGLANSMGLFLQKANIIRDYLEDYVDGRAFWPQSTWRKHTLTDDLGEFARPTAHGAGARLPMKGAAGQVAAKGVGVQALACVNELVADALELVPDCLEYLERLKTPAVFRFCAIPQVMALATLDECFDNPKLFTGVVKIRKGLTARLICATVDGPDATYWWFRHFARKLTAAIKEGTAVGADGPLGERIVRACERIETRTEARAAAWDARKAKQMMAAGGVGAALVAFSYAWRA
jgi:farnesyl-diphosphate farnesyltransferase